MTTPDPDRPDSPIELYLDGLVAGMSSGRPRDLRYLLAEAEAHLRDESDRLVAAGLPQPDAEAEAVRRMGPVAGLVQAEDRRQATPPAVLARELFATGLLLGGIAAAAVGISGIIAAVVRLAWGAQALVDVAPGQTLAAADCARWLTADPTAHSCRDAAVADWVFEVIGYRLVVGLLGVLALVAYVALRRRWTRRGVWATLPTQVSDTLAVALFGLAAAWTLALGLDAVVGAGGHGAGQWLSAAPVTLVATAVFGFRLVRDLRAPAGVT